MDYILKELIASLNNGNILPAVVIAVLALIFNFKKIVECYVERKKARITILADALKCEYVTGLTKLHLEEEIATEYFKVATGIRLEKQSRETVIQAHKNMNGKVAFIHFKRALPHLLYEKNILKVKVSLFEKIVNGFNLFFGFAFLFLGLVLMVLPSQMEGVKFVEFIAIFVGGGFFVAISFLLLALTFSVFSAQKIEKYLSDETHNNSIQPTVNTSTD